MDNKILIICGPTATGKTAFGLDICHKFHGEIISADSRQVYKGMDIITGKDIPPEFKLEKSDLVWMGKKVEYFTNGQIRIWLTGVVNPDFQFSVSCYKDLADLIISDINSRGKLPVVVGSTGLYIKSLTDNLSLIHIPQDHNLRRKLSQTTSAQLYDTLKNIDPAKAVSLNNSDRHNPLRLIRAIEIALSPHKPLQKNLLNARNQLKLCLNGPTSLIFERIDNRVNQRINTGALSEINNLLSAGYSWELKSLQTTGCRVWKSYLQGKSTLRFVETEWKTGEHRDYKRQLTWFKKQSGLNWIDVSQKDWQKGAQKIITHWLGK